MKMPHKVAVDDAQERVETKVPLWRQIQQQNMLGVLLSLASHFKKEVSLLCRTRDVKVSSNLPTVAGV